MSSIGQSYKRFKADGPYDTIVIGSGIGGLVTAAMLAKHADKRVLVLEQHYTAGGYTHAFRRKGYEWDVGIHYIGDVGHPKAPMQVILDDICVEPIEWANMGDVVDRIVIGDESYELLAGKDAFLARLKQYFPREEAALDRYLELVLQVQRASQPFFAERAIPKPMSLFLGKWMRGNFERLASRTTREVLEELTQDQKLIGVLTGQFGDYGLPPAESSFAIHSLIVTHYLRGGFFPIGGSSRFATTIVPTIENHGGAVVVRAEVESILIEGGRAVGVHMADGREFRAKRIVSDAGYHNTFRKLLPESARGDDGTLPGVPASIGHLCLYLGFTKTAEELGLQKANYWIYPDEHHEKNVAAFQADPEAPFPMVYVSFPAAKDPTFAERFPGRSTVDIITMAPYEWFERWQDSRWRHRDEDYEDFKQRFTDRLLEVLYRFEPQLEEHLDHVELSTPLTTRHFAAWEKGELYGLDHTPSRFRERALRPRTSIKNLYLTGQDICSAGVGGALFGGVLCASAILNRDMTRVARRSLGR